MKNDLYFVDACTDEHFAAMSLIHALGWRDTYAEAIPLEWMAENITDDRWVPLFRRDFEQKRCHGLLLYRNETPVACINYGPARTDNYNAGQVCAFPNTDYQDWGEVISFYTHPDERGKGYGSLLFEEAVRRLERDGYHKTFVFVLRENDGARRFYARHGFSWDGTHADIPFPPDTICVDLRYVKK